MASVILFSFTHPLPLKLEYQVFLGERGKGKTKELLISPLALAVNKSSTGLIVIHALDLIQRGNQKVV